MVAYHESLFLLLGIVEAVPVLLVVLVNLLEVLTEGAELFRVPVWRVGIARARLRAVMLAVGVMVFRFSHNAISFRW